MYTSAEIAPGIHQFRFYDAKRGIGFNQYLIAADEPALVSTGALSGFDAGSQAGQVTLEREGEPVARRHEANAERGEVGVHLVAQRAHGDRARGHVEHRGRQVGWRRAGGVEPLAEEIGA